MKPLLDLTLEDLRQWVTEQGHPAFRAKQIRRWLFATRVRDFSEMTDLPQPLREALVRDFQIWSSTVVTHSQATDGTEKLLLQMSDGGRIECVLLRDGNRRTICISTQVGCAMG